MRAWCADGKRKLIVALEPKGEVNCPYLEYNKSQGNQGRTVHQFTRRSVCRLTHCCGCMQVKPHWPIAATFKAEVLRLIEGTMLFKAELQVFHYELV
jgi:hypothetical protein